MNINNELKHFEKVSGKKFTIINWTGNTLELEIDVPMYTGKNCVKHSKRFNALVEKIINKGFNVVLL